jgi:hypothetical protein
MRAAVTTARAVLAVLVETDATLTHWWGCRTDDERALIEARCEAAAERAGA